MSFRDLKINNEYRSLLHDVVREFYTPLLSQACLYQRAVGFFSSSALISMTEGIRGLLENNGRIEVVASPRLTEEDLTAIKDGLERRDDIIVDSLLRELDAPKGAFEEARLNLLSNLIAAGVMTIKIALLDSTTDIGMFHEKLGLIYDSFDNVVAFSGSMKPRTPFIAITRRSMCSLPGPKTQNVCAQSKQRFRPCGTIRSQALGFVSSPRFPKPLSKDIKLGTVSTSTILAWGCDGERGNGSESPSHSKKRYAARLSERSN